MRFVRWCRSLSLLVQLNVAGIGLLFWLLVYNNVIRPHVDDDNPTLAYAATWLAVCVVLFGWDRTRR